MITLWRSWRERKRLEREMEERRQSMEKTPLVNVCATVFIRQPNGSRTDLEHSVEATLIRLGARVVIANQKIGMTLLRDGVFELPAMDADVVFAGTLIVCPGKVRKKRHLESEYDFKLRKANHDARLNAWNEKNYFADYPDDPKPVLEPRRCELVDAPVSEYVLAYRILDKAGTILASGAIEHYLDPEEGECETGIFEDIAEKVGDEFHGEDLWSKIQLV